MRSSAQPVVLVDVGGVLCSDGLPAVMATWSRRLDVSQQSLLRAVFAGSDEAVLVGRKDEDTWWQVVAERLGIGPGLLSGLREAITSAGVWDHKLVAYLPSLQGRARLAIVSNAWPHLRARLADQQHLCQVADTVVLSCEVGCAKPDPRIYRLALDHLSVAADKALFIDDTPGHVAAAISAGLRGHLHTSRTSTVAAIETFLDGRPYP